MTSIALEKKRWGIPYETKAGKKIRHLTKFNEIDGKKCEDIEPVIVTIVSKGKTTFDDRLKAKVCELCGKTDGKLEVHHVNKVKKSERQRTLGASDDSETAQNIGGMLRLPPENTSWMLRVIFVMEQRWRAVCIERCKHGFERGLRRPAIEMW